MKMINLSTEVNACNDVKYYAYAYVDVKDNDEDFCHETNTSNFEVQKMNMVM